MVLGLWRCLSENINTCEKYNTKNLQLNNPGYLPYLVDHFGEGIECKNDRKKAVDSVICQPPFFESVIISIRRIAA